MGIMSTSYAAGLSKYKNKGSMGSKEYFDSDRKLSKSVSTLAKWIKDSKYPVIHCGAGISTSAGIPDFRGPKGVWTLERKKIRLDNSNLKSFDACVPTFTHRAIIAMLNKGFIKHVISQNIDGLFLKSNIDRNLITELHGNYFVDECHKCMARFKRCRPSPTMCCHPTGDLCSFCNNPLYDTILDWDNEIAELEMESALTASKKSDLAICIGTSLQMEPANEFPLMVKKEDPDAPDAEDPIKKLVIINLQNTKVNQFADLVIHNYADKVMELLCKELNIEVKEFDPSTDPTKANIDLVPWNRENFIPQLENA